MKNIGHIRALLGSGALLYLTLGVILPSHLVLASTGLLICLSALVGVEIYDGIQAGKIDEDKVRQLERRVGKLEATVSLKSMRGE
jgi:hypothetical protein